MFEADDHPRLDATDRKLIGLLMADGRRSYASLALEVGLSQAATRVRVQRLLSDRIIDVNARVDPTVLGHGVFAFTVLTVRGPHEQTAARIAEIPEAVFLVKTSGRWDLLVEIRTIDNAALIEVLDRVRGIEAVTDAETLVVLRYAKQDWATDGLISDIEEPTAAPAIWPASNTIDETDLKLIHGLVADGRASFTDLASTVGLSHAAVRDRVLRLLGGALVVRAVPGPGATDHLSWAGLLIKISAEAGKIAASLAERRELTLVAVSAGRFGVVCEARAEDLDDLHRLTEWVRGVEGVDSVEALHYVDIVKQEFEGGGI